jgi:hypothetical protein
MPASQRQPLFDCRVDVYAKIQACLDSGVELTEWEQEILNNWKSYQRPTQRQYKLLWEVCRKCGVK